MRPKKIKKMMYSLVFIALVAMIAGAAKLYSESSEESAYIGSEQCLGCHEGYDEPLMQTRHRMLFADKKDTGAKSGCEGCHGPGAAHLEDPEAGVMRFATAPGEKVAAACLKCHAGDAMKNWKMGAHASEGISCVTCHTVHKEVEDKADKSKKSPKNLLKDNQPDLCVSCHEAHVADLNMPSRHPIKEGKVACSDCHSPHDTSPLSIENAKTNCASCHPEKAGPFLYEHEPVSDSCDNCHAPHGSVNQNLLTLRMPTLCFQCHTVAAMAPAHDPAVSTFKNCTTCHKAIHGSNSQETFQAN